ncbi:MAG: hypothetical protein NW241_23680 [Bacteroidia bacterium]|nr:hypothetical protein [Bacteroidia bacterium]
MNTRMTLPLAFAVLSLAACKPDPVTPEPRVDPPLVLLSYDASNQSAPLLPGGSYEGAIRLSALRLSPFAGGTLQDVYVYIQDLPASATLKIYRGAVAGTPGELVYSEPVFEELTANSWNQHVLKRTVVLEDNTEYWIAFSFAHSRPQSVLGCDPGPASVDGDWMFDGADGQWRPLVLRTSGQIDINWNIRAVVNP